MELDHLRSEWRLCIHTTNTTFRRWSGVLALLVVAALTACGGNGDPTSGPTSQNRSATQVDDSGATTQDAEGIGNAGLENAVDQGDSTATINQQVPASGSWMTLEALPAPKNPTNPSPGARIASIEVGQSLLFNSTDTSVALVANKATLLKVNVVSSVSGESPPSATVRVQSSTGATLQTIALTSPTTTLPTSTPAVPSFANSYTATVPANLVQSGVRMAVTLNNGSSAVTAAPRVMPRIDIRVVAVPVQLGTTVGQIVPNSATYLQDRLPSSTLAVQNRAAYVSQRVASLPATESAWSTAFSNVLGEMYNLQIMEAGGDDQTYYYGFMPKRTFGLMGLGYVGANAGVGVDMPTRPTQVLETMLHEIGHNMSLPHAPCGGPSGPDPNYPYPNAQLGGPGRYIWGFLASTRTFVDPRRTDIHDVMSYCDGNTFSDYNQNLILNYIGPSGLLMAGLKSERAEPLEQLLISGQVAGDQVSLSPVKAFLGRPTPPIAGGYRLRITSTNGTVEYAFGTTRLDHSAAQHFAFSIPSPGVIEEIAVLKDGVELYRAGPPRSSALTPQTTPSTTGALVQVVEQFGSVTMKWDAQRYPYLSVTHVGARKINLTQDATGGEVTLPTSGLPTAGQWEFSLSDGFNSIRVQQAR